MSSLALSVASSALSLKAPDAAILEVPATAVARKRTLLEASAGIVAIVTPDEMHNAAVALRPINDEIAQVEADRKTVKAPVLELAKLIDETAKRHCAELLAEKHRVSALINSFQREQERQRQEAARQAEAERLRLQREAEERQRAAEAAQRKIREESEAKARAAESESEAKRIAAQAKIDEARARIAAERERQVIAAKQSVIPLPVAPPKVAGVSTRKVPKFEVQDLAAAYAAHPELFTVEPKTAEINARVRAGMSEWPGVRIWWDTQTIV